MLRTAATVLALSLLAVPASGQEKDLATLLREREKEKLATAGFTDRPLQTAVGEDIRARRAETNRRSTEEWRKLEGRADWERFRDAKIDALRRSLGAEMPVGEKPTVHVTGRHEGEGYRLENLVYESRPGLWVTANLYLPAKPGKAMPAVLIIHSHHNPKTQSELQDMGINWARLGCAVLIPDQPGHGERRVHPFVDAESYPGTFRPSRQDYYFRYNLGMQLHLAGESLIGWMAHDMRRGLDLLLARGDIDREKIMLFGSVAGGGDPAGVTAALDRRITAVAPFNFGGPQPETIFPLPADADASFNFAGGGSWESTRNLRLSARDGFLPWVIVGSVAPRRLIHAHEFAWDGERDPVWKRYGKIFSFYDAAENLGVAHGRGKLSGRPPEATHCNNIGAEHRKPMYPLLKRWFDLSAPEKENQERRPSTELMCWTADLKRELKPMAVWEAARKVGTKRAEAARKQLDAVPEAERVKKLREDWSRILGGVAVPGPAKVLGKDSEKVGDVALERLLLEVEGTIPVPVLLLRPAPTDDRRMPAVVCVSQAGKAEFLARKADAIGKLLGEGVAVCLIDVRGTGETRADSGRGRSGSATGQSASEQMLGRTTLGNRLRDLRTVMDYLRTRPEIDGKRLGLWGESFARVNGKDERVEVPLDAEKQPAIAEPLGALLVTLGALYEDVLVAYGNGGLASYASLLDSAFVHVPHDAVVPEALTVGDLGPVEKAVGKRLRLDARVDGLNRAVRAPEPTESEAEWLLHGLKQ